jgi:hypothetical protein
MNPRIKELMEQAKITSTAIDPFSKMPYEYTHFSEEKFAELIVEECANVADENYIHRGSRTCGLAIRLHFGVEEPKGWICSKCGTDRTKAVCPQGPSASVDGRCPMIASAQ